MPHAGLVQPNEAHKYTPEHGNQQRKRKRKKGKKEKRKKERKIFANQTDPRATSAPWNPPKPPCPCRPNTSRSYTPPPPYPAAGPGAGASGHENLERKPK